MKNWEKLYTDTCDNNRRVMKQLSKFIYDTVILHGFPLIIDNIIQYSVSLDYAGTILYLYKDSLSHMYITVIYRNGYYFNYCLESSEFVENVSINTLFLICDKLEEKYGK